MVKTHSAYFKKTFSVYILIGVKHWKHIYYATCRFATANNVFYIFNEAISMYL